MLVIGTKRLEYINYHRTILNFDILLIFQSYKNRFVVLVRIIFLLNFLNCICSGCESLGQIILPLAQVLMIISGDRILPGARWTKYNFLDRCILGVEFGFELI